MGIASTVTIRPETCDKLHVLVPFRFTAIQMSSLLTSALEGGSNYWYMFEARSHRFEFAGEELCDEEGWIEISNEGIAERASDEFKIVKINQSVAKHALRIMAEKYPKHFGDLIAENEDAGTGDVFLQCCVFGEVIYG